MKAAGGPQKLRFTIHSCSGEDTDYPVRELLYHSPQTRGWQSPRFCKYPQELVLRLERPCKIQQIQILAHEYKIPTKIEVFVGGLANSGGPDAAPGGGGGGLRRLGYLSFDSNERSNHQARELKSVHVTVDAQLVRLVIHRCHVNKLNIYNQVGVIALNLIGEPLRSHEGPPGFLDTDSPVSHELPYYNRAAGELADLTLDMHVDSVTAARIKELVRAKDSAVAAEDYDEAKRLKAAIERLKVVGGKVAQLEARKRLAVEREDYDLAKALKTDIEKLRSAGESAAVSSPPGQQPSQLSLQHGQQQQQQALRHAPDAGDRLLQQQAAAAGEGCEGHEGGLLSGGTDAAAAADAAAYGDAYGEDGYGGAAAAAAGQQQPHVLHTYQAYEDRPAMAKAALMARAGSSGSAGGADGGGGDGGLGDLAEDDLIRADPSRVSAAAMFGASGGGGSRRGMLGGGGGSSNGAAAAGSSAAAARRSGAASPPAGVGARDDAAAGPEAPPGWPSDLPVPEPLTAVSASEAGPVVELAGEFVAAAFFSRAWQLRDAAAAWLADLVPSEGGQQGRMSAGERRDQARGLVRLAVKGLKDKVPQVYSSSLSLLLALLTALANSGSGRDVAQALEAALPVLLERLCDNNSRTRDSARDALVSLAQEPEGRAALRSQTALLCRLPRSQTAWRPVHAMLQLLTELVPLLGIAGAGGAARGAADTAGGSGGGAGGFELGEVMAYVGAAFGSANADVRAAALRVTVVAAEAAGPGAVRRLLPQGMNPKMREQVDAALGLEATQPAAAAQTPVAAKSSSRSAGGAPRSTGKAATASGHPNRQAAAAAAAAQPAGQRQQQPQQHQRQQQQQQHHQHQQQQQQLAALDAEDPTPFAAELAAREQQYGPNHPAVAESCSNLAILHNQRGDHAAALPLYERALAIYEANYGANHQEVAHTLTDLAVLHLEQGHDAVGRPLLERALVIQEAALGPDHPDVMAIRDVLSSE